VHFIECIAQRRGKAAKRLGEAHKVAVAQIEQALDLATEQERLEIGLSAEIGIEADGSMRRVRRAIGRVADLGRINPDQQRAAAGAYMHAAIRLWRDTHVEQCGEPVDERRLRVLSTGGIRTRTPVQADFVVKFSDAIDEALGFFDGVANPLIGFDDEVLQGLPDPMHLGVHRFERTHRVGAS